METRKRLLFFGTLRTRQAAAAGTVLALFLTLLPAALLRGDPLWKGNPDPPAGEADRLDSSGASTAPAEARDRGRAVRLLKKTGETVELTMDEYLWGVVAAEMPASFEPEALKAQACAARTYTVRQQNASSPKHPQADICGDSTCCQAWTERSDAELRWGLEAGEYAARIEEAVSATDGLGILYEDSPIQAVFFSSAAGKTVDAAQVWGNGIDYLKSVDSPEGEEVPNWHSQVTLTAEEVRSATLAAYPAADLSGDPASWFQDIVPGSGSSVASLKLGGVSLTGGQVRSLFQLRSASFTVNWTGEQFVFSVTGYGHGVGMSQYGANALAGQGKTFEDILTWYYTGARVGLLW